MNRKSTPLRLAVGSCLACLLLGCGFKNSISINLPEGTEARPGAPITVEAIIVQDDYPPEDGASVSFSTEVGSFVEFGTGHTEPLQSTDATTSGGKATVTLYSFPNTGGTGKLKVNFTTTGGYLLNAEASVTVKVPVPSGKNFTASCDSPNVSALLGGSERSNMKVRCVVRATDIGGAVVPRTNVQGMVEGGCSLTAEAQPAGSLDTFPCTLSVSCDPADVEPITGEPNWVETAGKIHNPRDGLLSLVFYAEGEEGYVDANGNGTWDPGESFAGEDLPEPWVDANDSGSFDTGELFVDVNGNGQWDSANGTWDAETVIWAPAHILFTGAPHEGADTTRFSPTGINIPADGSQLLTLHLMDINMNPIAANNASNSIALTVQGATLEDSSLSLLSTMGVTFNSEGKPIASSMDQERSYQITLRDSSPGAAGGAVQLDSTVNWTPGLAHGGYSPTQQSKALNQISGTSQ